MQHLVMSNRTGFIDTVRGMLARVSSGDPIVCRDLRSPAAHTLAEEALLVIDLATAQFHAELAEFVGLWRRRYPQARFVYIAPFQHPREAVVAAACAARAPGRVLDSQEWTQHGAWQLLLESSVLNQLEPVLENDLRAAGAVLGIAFKHADQVFEILRIAPTLRRIEDCPASIRVGGHRCPRGLIYGSRLLWYAKLREQGYEPWYIARALCFESSAMAGKSMREIWDVGLRELARVSYSAFVLAYATWLASPGTLLMGRLRFRDLRGGIKEACMP